MSGIGGGGGAATDVGSIRAGFIVDIADGKRKMTEIKTELESAASTAKKSSASMREVGDAIKETAAKKQQLEQLGKSLDNVNGRIEQQKKVLKSLKESYDATFDDGKKTQLEGKILNVEASLNKLTATSDKTARQMWELEDSMREVSVESDKTERTVAGLTSALTALGAGAAAVGMAKTVMTLTDEANQLANALTGVKQVAGALGHDVGQVTQVTEQLASRGVLSLTEAATAVKTALATGYDIEQTITLINTLTDAAAFNREAHLDWGEAVVTAIQGIKAGNSTLTDAAGITTNLSVMYDKYAKSIGTSAATLTDAGKAQAAYNGMIAEAAIFAGNADAVLAGYTGTNNSFKKSVEMARVELGESFLPIVQEITEKLTPMIQRFTDWVSENKEVVAGMTAAGIAVTGLIATVTTLITVVGALTMAFRALNVSMGPVGWAIAGVSALAVGVASYQVAADMAAESTWQFAESQEELNRKLNESPLTRSSSDLEKLISDYDTINALIERRTSLIDEYNRLASDRKSLSDANDLKDAWEWWTSSDDITKKMTELDQEIIEINKSLKELDVTADNAEETLSKMKTQIDASTPAMRALTIETLKQIDAEQDAIKETEQLAGRYRALTSESKLTKEQADELTSVVRKLTERYPELHAELDENGRLMIVNENIIRDLIAAEEDSVDAWLAGERAKQQALLQTAKAALSSAKTQLEALQAVASAYKQEVNAPALPDSIDGELSDSLALRRRMSGSFSEAIDANRAVNSGKLQAEVDAQQSEVDRIQSLINSLDDGSWADLYGNESAGSKDLFTPGKEKTKKEKTAKQKTAEEIANDAYRAALKQLEIRRLLGDLTEQQEIDTLAKLANQYKKYDDIWIDAESRRQRVVEQMENAAAKAAEQAAKDAEAKARASYETSAEWIEMQTRKMTEAGRSESEITKMQLDAWTRVRNRYDKDSDYYKRADKAMYDARMNLRKQDEKLAKEIADQQKEYVKESLKAIEAQKKAELAALDEKKKATQKYYDDLLRNIDDGERNKERAEIEAEAEKYRYATSERGQKYYAELLEQLRKMDVEDTKRAIEDERDAKLDGLDEQKADIESWYSDIKAAADAFNGDMIRLYELTDDARLQSFVTTNAAIKAEMARFQSEMASLAASAPSGNSGTIAQMQANSKAWHTADAAGKAKLAAENQALGQSLGASYSNGKWSLDGTPLFHSGRDGATGRTFSVSDRLMPDELTAILRDDEYVFTPGQLQSLLDTKSGANTGTVVNVEKVVGLEIGEATMEDEIDMRALGRTGNDLAADIVRNKFTRGE